MVKASSDLKQLCLLSNFVVGNNVQANSLLAFAMPASAALAVAISGQAFSCGIGKTSFAT